MVHENPFIVYPPEQQTPEFFRDTFVKENTYINNLEIPIDTFIDGWRGSGKSSLFNYIEFKHQLCYYNDDLGKFLNESRKNKYIGILIQVDDELLNTKKFDLLLENNLENPVFIRQLCMSDLITTILFRVLRTFLDCKKMTEYIDGLKKEDVKKFVQQSIKNLDYKKNYSIDFEKSQKNSELLKCLKKIFKNERRLISHFGNEIFQMKKISYSGNLPETEYLYEFISDIKKTLQLSEFSFYILIDNAEGSSKMMQLCIDELVNIRKHDDIAIKVAIRKGATWNFDKIQWPHDFIKIDVDELYSTKHTVYFERIKEISKKRLELEGFSVQAEDFFPDSPSEKKLLQEIKDELKLRYETEYDKRNTSISLGIQPSKKEFVANRVNKYAQAELFRRLKKVPKSYAGFENIVHLSSGVIRQFLDLSSNMFVEEQKRNMKSDIKNISLESQNEVIKKYADDFIDILERQYKELENQGDIVASGRYRKLYFLIEALGVYYKSRLMDPSLVEPRVFTFTLKDPNTDIEVEKILKTGVDMNYFQSYWYSSKIGTGKYKGYAFNRRLCPRYGIDHTSFRGRIELSTVDIKTAMETGKLRSSIKDTAFDNQTTLGPF